MDIGTLTKPFPGIDEEGGRFRAHLELAALANALKRRVSAGWVTAPRPTAVRRMAIEIAREKDGSVVVFPALSAAV